MLTWQQFQMAIADFVEKEILSQMVGLPRWLGFGGIFLASSRAEDIYKNMLANPMIKQLGIIDDNGLIDISSLYSPGYIL